MAGRLEGWEGRLHALVTESNDEAYELGVRDCFRFACRAIQALTGVDHWSRFAGRYHTRREALVLMHEFGSSFESAMDVVFGLPRVRWQQAQRGDVTALQSGDGEKHLGVVVDHRVAYTSEAGLVYLPLDRALCAWHVG